ncbi:MAG: hypothetical protein ACRCUZ_14095 [Shewanella sp.]
MTAKMQHQGGACASLVLLSLPFLMSVMFQRALLGVKGGGVNARLLMLSDELLAQPVVNNLLLLVTNLSPPAENKPRRRKCFAGKIPVGAFVVFVLMSAL